MLTLMLLRHAKAAQHVPDGDFLRPLTDKGESDAAALGVFLEDSGLMPDYAFVSESLRTRQTFETVQAQAKRKIPSQVDESLYNATASQLRDLLRVVDGAIETLMIVGHNPGIMDLAIAMTQAGDLMEINRMRGRFPPCSLAILTFDTKDWLDAHASGGRLDLYLLPDDLVQPH